MQKGIVKFFDGVKGFGFITNGDTDIFVHVSGLEEEIKQDDNVSYDIGNGKRGLMAVNVRKIN